MHSTQPRRASPRIVGLPTASVKFTSCPKRTPPASERAATATSCEHALDVQDAARSLEPDGKAIDRLPAAWPWEARAEARTPAGAATGQAEASEAAHACQAQADAGLSAAARAPADPIHTEGALTLVDLPAHVIACVVDQLPANEELAVALTCRRLRTASEHSSRSARAAPLTTRIGAQLAFGTRHAADDSPELPFQLAAQAAISP
jgi:hypothetical protein